MQHRALIVDDDADIRETLRDILTCRGFDVRTARDGKIAYEFLTQFASPCVVLLDLRMPFVDGWMLASWMRAHPRLGKTPLVLMSANAREEAQAGERILGKPFQLDHLSSILRVVERDCACCKERALQTV